jgi:hypothetical protein
MPDLRRNPRTCRQFGGRIAERTGSRSGSGEREPRRTHGASGRKDRGQEGSFLLQALGREGPQSGSGSQARRSNVLNARQRCGGGVPPACLQARPVSWAVRLPRAILGLLRDPRNRAIGASVGGVRRRSDRPKQLGGNFSAQCEPLCLAPSTRKRLPIPVASVSSD